MKATIAIHSTEACLVARVYSIRILIQTEDRCVAGWLGVLICMQEVLALILTMKVG